MARQMVLRVWLATAFAATLTSNSPVVGQFGQPAGVYIDADGVLQSRKLPKGSDLARLRAKRARGKTDEQLAFVSLPKLFAEVKRLHEAKQPIPDAMRYLDGVVKLQYVFVYPDEKDLVIAGPAEELEISDPARPLGAATGRPALRLDDLVVALRTAGPGKTANVFGCSLDMAPEALDRLRTLPAQVGAIQRGQAGRALETALRTIGVQQVRFFGIEPDSQFAFVCLEADYLLKRFALGLDPMPVKGVVSHLSLLKKGESTYNRWWFAANYEPIEVTADGNGFALHGQGLRLLSSRAPTGGDDGVPSAKKFAALFTVHFPELAEAVPAFADLWNVTDLAVLAGLIGADRLHEKCQWDLAWVLREDGYPVPKVRIPRTAESLGNYKSAGRNLTILDVGGVELSTRAVVAQRRTSSAGALKLETLARQRATGGWSLRVAAR